jgi:hypothetical protein
MILDISIGSNFATVIPDDLRARAAGAFQAVNYGTRPLGALTAGGLGTLIGCAPPYGWPLAERPSASSGCFPRPFPDSGCPPTRESCAPGAPRVPPVTGCQHPGGYCPAWRDLRTRT